jgi:hypothetical protein
MTSFKSIVVNSVQISFVDERMVETMEAPAQSDRPSIQLFDGTCPGVRCALAPKHIGRKEPLMQLPPPRKVSSWMQDSFIENGANLLTGLKQVP